MGLWEDMLKGVGDLAGFVVEAGGDLVAEVTGIEEAKEVGRKAHAVTRETGRTVGQITGGVLGGVVAILEDDTQEMERSANEVGSAIGRTASNVVQGVKTTGGQALEVVEGISTGDNEKVSRAAKALASTAAVGILSFGLVDIADGAEVADGADVVEGESLQAADSASTSGLANPSEAQAAVAGGSAPIPGDYASFPHSPDVPAPLFPGPDSPGTELLPQEPGTGESPGNDDPGTHHVKPHWVEGYTRADGTYVGGYWRDGDGDTSVDLDEDEGGGYIRSNPDGDPTNNLKP